jgi:hypothetical protein
MQPTKRPALPTLAALALAFIGFTVLVQTPAQAKPVAADPAQTLALVRQAQQRCAGDRQCLARAALALPLQRERIQSAPGVRTPGVPTTIANGVIA